MPTSDIDLLAIVDGMDKRFDPNVYSIYSYDRIHALWHEGNPFAWHLSLEARLLFASDGTDFLASLASPAPYQNRLFDCEKFHKLFHGAVASILLSRSTLVFDLSTIFLSIRNFATCFSLGLTVRPDFSRDSARRLSEDPVPISQISYSTLENARILCTRGIGDNISSADASRAISEFGAVDAWMFGLIKKVKQ